MNKLIKKNKNMTAYVLCAAILYVLWAAGNYINTALSNIEILRLPNVQEQSKPIDAKSFYAVWVQQAMKKKSADAKSGSDGEVNDLFKKADVAKSADSSGPQESDYPSIFGRMAQLDAVAVDGAIIGGHYYKVGASMQDLGFPGKGGQQIVPILVSVGKSSAVVNLGKSVVTVTSQNGSR